MFLVCSYLLLLMILLLCCLFYCFAIEYQYHIKRVSFCGSSSWCRGLFCNVGLYYFLMFISSTAWVFIWHLIQHPTLAACLNEMKCDMPNQAILGFVLVQIKTWQYPAFLLCQPVKKFKSLWCSTLCLFKIWQSSNLGHYG